MRIERYEGSHQSRWDDFVSESLNGTIMHSRRFLAYHPSGRFQDHSLLIWQDNRLIAVFPAAEVVHLSGRILQSHPGASYGGLVVDRRSNAERCRASVASLVEYACENTFDGIRIRTAERIFHRRWCEEVDGAYHAAGFMLEGRELSCAVFCHAHSADQLLARYRVNARNAVHKSMRDGVRACPSEAFEDFWAILEQNLEQSHRVRPTHTLDEILRLRSLIGTDRVVLMGGFWEERLVSGCVLFVMNDRAAHTMYMAQNYEHQHLRSLNLVLHAALSFSAERGLHFLNFGISSIPGTQGREMNFGLDAFKRSFAGEGVLRDLWYKPCLPPPEQSALGQ